MSFSTNVPFPPIYANRPPYCAADPHGLRPLMRRIRAESKKTILHWDVNANRLAIWHWPVVDGQRIPPSDLDALRQTHVFRGPCCLCATQTQEYTEAPMFMVTTGRLAGEYVAACAQGNCKYWAFLERIYNKIGLPIKSYPPRPFGAPAVLPVRFSPGPPSEDESLPSSNSPVSTPTRARGRNEGSSSSSSSSSAEVHRMLQPTVRPAKRARISVTVDYASQLTETQPLSRRRPSSPFGLLMALDSPRRGGITVEEFNGLFTKCNRCRIITTKSAFRFHGCERGSAFIPENAEVIDLTIGDD